MSCNHDCHQDCNQGRSCDALGLCQSKTPPCSGCRPLMLAPGVLEAYRPPFLGSAQQRRELLRWARWCALLGATAAAVGLLAGLWSGWPT